jgi:pyruvate/2-oxoglutarate dehydrogenase complex dihydrolipoamide acyltransferase (E2) component
MPESSAVLVPQMNVNDDQAVIVAWQVPNRGRVAEGDVIATLETTKSTFDVHAPCAGHVIYELEAKSLIAVGAVLAWISGDPNASPSALAAPSTQPPESAAEAADARITRKALRRMRELGVSASELPAGSRIEVADVERVAAARTGADKGKQAAAVAQPVESAAAARSQPPPDLCEALEQSPSKIMEAARLSEVYRSVVPSMVTLPLATERVRAKLDELAAAIGPLSLLELVIHEAPAILADYRELNGFFSGGRGWTYRDIAIGFAVNSGKGLKVPVVREAARLTQLDVCRKVRDLTLRYFRDEITMADVTGGTFTITDLSAQGVTQFVPVLNDRQAAILGICAPDLGGAQQNLVLAFDHRMSDGMRGAAFLSDLRDRLET